MTGMLSIPPSVAARTFTPGENLDPAFSGGMRGSGKALCPKRIRRDLPEKAMPYYVESEAHQLREKFEEIVLGWPGVSKKLIFGSPSYVAGGTIFAMLVTGGIILTRLDDDQKSALLSGGVADYFTGHGRVMKKWIVIPVKDPSSIERYLPYITASYHAALVSERAET